MLKKTITYTDYNGMERTEDFYFNLSEAELTEMQLSTEGGFAEMVQRIVNAKDTPSIIKIFKDLVLRSYGEKSTDGKRFIKNDELRDGFAQTEAYSVLFMELATDDEKAAAFINGVVPRSVSEKANSPEVQAEIKKLNPGLETPDINKNMTVDAPDRNEAQ